MADQTLEEMILEHETAFIPDQAEGVEAEVQYHLTGEEGGDWIIKLDGDSCTVEAGISEKPKVVVKADAQDFKQILSGEADPMNYFMKGKLKISGDLGLAVKLTSFFQTD